MSAVEARAVSWLGSTDPVRRLAAQRFLGGQLAELPDVGEQ